MSIISQLEKSSPCFGTKKTQKNTKRANINLRGIRATYCFPVCKGRKAENSSSKDLSNKENNVKWQFLYLS